MKPFENGDRVVFLGDSIIGCSRIATPASTAAFVWQKSFCKIKELI